MSATIRDVARLAGVNPSTVSRVINEKSVITAETRERVYSAMAQLDYHPNSLARSLVSGLAGAIGMVLDTGDDGAFNNAFFGSSQYAIEQVAQAHGYHLLIANGGERALETVTELVLGKKVDGLILPPSAATPQVMARIGDFPHVILGQPDEDMCLNTWVDVDNRSGAALATAHLLEQAIGASPILAACIRAAWALFAAVCRDIRRRCLPIVPRACCRLTLRPTARTGRRWPAWQRRSIPTPLCATITSRPLDCCAPRATGACVCRRILALRPSTMPHWRSIWIRR